MQGANLPCLTARFVECPGTANGVACEIGKGALSGCRWEPKQDDCKRRLGVMTAMGLDSLACSPLDGHDVGWAGEKQGTIHRGASRGLE
jgi:hypothetical protein